ncbi:MAG: STELLO glycosyltransferase family protein [Planctomycetota bacterium]|jgi:hypothetical protein
MQEKVSVVVTSIAEPNEVLRKLARGCVENGYEFLVIGDDASPSEFHIQGCDFYSLERQEQTGLEFARRCPTRHYARKNIGYLLAIRNGASVIIETDDDNIAYPQFWPKPQRIQEVPVVREAGWVNVYRYFTDQHIWPRGFPLEQVQQPVPTYESLAVVRLDCPIQQRLADDNPDVDAVYRLVMSLPQRFRNDRRIGLDRGSWCPFNSQNTVWWSEAFELLYLPAYCSFRMTDIWRSLIAQRICWLNGWSVLFCEPTVRQQRNEHNLLRDFADEIPGYMNNEQIRETLEALPLEPGMDKIGHNLMACYEKLVGLSLVGREEISLLDAWLEDIKQRG